MDPLHACIAFGPVAMYLIVLGIINLSPRPLVTTGARDAIALGLAIAGLVVAGPMELFLIEAAVAIYGGWVWAMMIACYFLLVLLIASMLRPRLVIYNVTGEQLLPVLEDVLGRIDPQVRWVGNCVVSQQLGVSLHIELLPIIRNAQLVAGGPQQNLAGWRRLERELTAALRNIRGERNYFGRSLVVAGLFIAGLVTWLMAEDPAAVQQALSDMLRQ